MASRISRKAAKSGCACEWGAWGQISEDGPGQHNPDRSEDPWGRAAEAARTEVHKRTAFPGTERGVQREACEQFASLAYRHAPAQLVEEVEQHRHVNTGGAGTGGRGRPDRGEACPCRAA